VYPNGRAENTGLLPRWMLPHTLDEGDVTNNVATSIPVVP
jgi:hypothetical protein